MRSLLHLTLLVAAAFANSPALASCADLIQRIEEAASSKQLTEVRRLEGEFLSNGCTSKELQVRKLRSALEVEQASALKARQGQAAEVEALLVASFKPPLNWEAGRALGDYYYRQRRYAEATRTYEATIEVVENSRLTDPAPPKEEIVSLVNRANQARLLAANEENPSLPPQIIPPKRDASGRIGGGLSPSVRGVVVREVPVPIRFETGKAEFTTEGRQAAAELVAALKQQNPQVITLIGHTDDRGEDHYNMRLSEQRVRAVAQFLAGQGIKGNIRLDWRGERDPLKLEMPEGHSREEIWAMNRRVVWVRE